MSHLTVYDEDRPATPIVDTGDGDRIAKELREAGIRLERWEASRDLPPDADNDAIVSAYRPEIDRLVNERGYQTFDVVSMHPMHPDKNAFRKKFLDEHTHSEDEVRFFVRGQGLFVIHANGRVYSIL